MAENKSENENMQSISKGRRLCVALVDDEEETSSVLAEFLERKEWRTEIFIVAEDLLNSKPNRFHAVILDIHLPGMWGTECAFRLRNGGYKNPIIAITGNIETQKCLLRRTSLGSLKEFLLKHKTQRELHT